MSQQRDLLGIHGMACYKSEDWNPGKALQRECRGTLLESPEMLLQGCGIRFQETGNVRRRPGAGRPHATTSADDFSQTVRNRLHEGGLYARRPMVCIPLTPRHRAARRRWAAEHRDWEQHDWSQVLFTDESRFSLESDTGRVLVWRDRGTRNNPAFVRERSQYRKASWMVWGVISIGGRTDLHIIQNGTLTGRRYADEILRPHVIPY
ncbi:transposable element Tcb2 transposase, partial [Trichonephila clavipes]